jgi:hypothetical protein
MKLLLPVAVMTLAAGICCCGGDSDMEDLMEQIEAQPSASADDATASASTGEATATTGEATASASTGGSDAGLCGRFKTDGFTYPSGLSVVACADTAGSESVLLQGSGDPSKICKDAKAWASGKGWTVQTEAEMMGTSSVIMKNADKQLTLACTEMGGQTTLSMSVSQGY